MSGVVQESTWNTGGLDTSTSYVVVSNFASDDVPSRTLVAPSRNITQSPPYKDHIFHKLVQVGALDGIPRSLEFNDMNGVSHSNAHEVNASVLLIQLVIRIVLS